MFIKDRTVYSYHINLITWNIKVDMGPTLFPWNKRKEILKEVLLQEQPDVLCVQEAKKNQVDFLVQVLDGYKYIGVGREDGKDNGEHCAIIYNPTIITLRNQETFWLSDTPDIPSKGYDLYPRVCTHGTFEELVTRKTFHIFNTHLPLPLNFSGKEKSIAVVLDHIKPHRAQSPVILTADFNATPQSSIWKKILAAGFKKPPYVGRTARILRIPTFCFDAVFVNNRCSLHNDRRITHHHTFLFPSDHYGIATEVSLL